MVVTRSMSRAMKVSETLSGVDEEFVVTLAKDTADCREALESMDMLYPDSFKTVIVFGKKKTSR